MKSTGIPDANSDGQFLNSGGQCSLVAVFESLLGLAVQHLKKVV